MEFSQLCVPCAAAAWLAIERYMIAVAEPRNQQMEDRPAGGGSGSSSGRTSEKEASGVMSPVAPECKDGSRGGGSISSLDRSSDGPSRSDGPTSTGDGGVPEEEVLNCTSYVGTAARLTAPPPAPSSMPRRRSAHGNNSNGPIAADTACTSGPSSISAQDEGGDGRKPPPPPASASASAPRTQPSASAARAAAPRRRSLLGVSYNGMTAPLSGNEEPAAAAAAAAPSPSSMAGNYSPAAATGNRTPRRHSMLGVAYNGETAPLAGGADGRGQGAAAAAASASASASASARTAVARRHSMLGASYSGMAAELAGKRGAGHGTTAQGPAPAGAGARRRNSLLGVSYGGMTAPLSSEEGQARDGATTPADAAPSGPVSNPHQAYRRLSMPKAAGGGGGARSVSNSANGAAERRLSMPRAEIGTASRETISRSSSLAHSATSSVIDQTRRPSLTEIQDFLDDDDDDDDDESDDEVDLGGDGERMAMSSKAGRRLSMPRAEIGTSSRETIRSHSLTTMQIETRRLSLTEVQNYLDGDSSDDDDDDDGMHPKGASANANRGRSNSTDDAPNSQPLSPPGQSRRHSVASASSRASQPRSILRRHSSYGSNAPSEVPQYIRPDLIRRASLQQQTTSSTTAGGNEILRRDRSSSIGSSGSSVSFSSVSVRSHSQTLGDHPCCHRGPPIALDWQYEDHRPVLVDDWETYRVRDGGANSEKMYIPPHFRRNVLEYRYGHSREETAEAARAAKMARRRRSMTRTMQPLAGIVEAGETVAGFAKNVVKGGRQVTQRKKARRRDSAQF